MDKIEVGQIVNTHGIKGEVKVNPWTDNVDVFSNFDYLYAKNKDEFLKLNIEHLRFHKNCAIIKFKEIMDMNDAESYKGITLYIDKNLLGELPEGVYYIADLIGLTVKTDTEVLGNVADVFPTGSNDVYVVRQQGKKDLLIPVIHDVILEINPSGGYILVKLLDGLLDV